MKPACSVISNKYTGIYSLVSPLCSLLALGVVVGIFYFGASPFAVGLAPRPWDIVLHFAVYGAITALALLGTRMRFPVSIFLLICLIGGVDELRQLQIPGRNADVLDFAADATAGAATIAGALFLHYRNKLDHRIASTNIK